MHFVSSCSAYVLSDSYDANLSLLCKLFVALRSVLKASERAGERERERERERQGATERDREREETGAPLPTLQASPGESSEVLESDLWWGQALCT